MACLSFTVLCTYPHSHEFSKQKKFQEYLDVVLIYGFNTVTTKYRFKKQKKNILRANSPAVKTELAQTRTRCQGDSSEPAEHCCQRQAARAADRLDATGCESYPGTGKEKKRIFFIKVCLQVRFTCTQV